ncbi:MAG: C40 family peptidase [Bacteroidia bacterium]
MKKRLQFYLYLTTIALYSTQINAQEVQNDALVNSTFSPISFSNNDTTTLSATTSITNTLNEWHKTHYQMGGNSKRGIDCSHFTAVVYKNTYGKIISGSARDYYTNADTTFTSPLELKIGDMVFFNINGRSLSHVGVYVGNNEFVHATVHAGVIKSNLNEPYYTRYYKGGARFNNLTAQRYVFNTQELLAQNNDTNNVTVVKKQKTSSKKTKKHTVSKKKNSKKKLVKKQPKKKTSAKKKGASTKKISKKKSSKKKK